MKRYIDFIYKFQKPLMLLFILINITAIYGVFQLDIQTDFDIFKIENSEYLEHLNILEKEFPTSDQILIMVEDVDKNDAQITELENALENMNQIEAVKGIHTALPFPKELISGSDLDKELEGLSSIKNIDGKTYGIITVFPTTEFGYNDLKDIEKVLVEKDLTYYISGNPYMQNKIFDYLLFILLVIPPSAIFILFNIFRIQMKSVKGTLLSVMPAGIAALWTLGFAGLFGDDISILTVLAPIFTIIIGSADGLHFISHVQEHLEDGKSMRESLTLSLGMVGVPMIITTVTSVFGFISLMFMNTKAIYDLAIYASIGIALAGVATWFIIPLINSFEHLDIHKKPSKINININFKKTWGKPSYIIVMLLMTVSVFAIPNIKTEFNQLMMYKDYTEVSKNFDKIMDVNGGTIPVFALIKYEGNPFSPTIVKEVKSYTQALTQDEHISKVVSIYTITDVLSSKIPDGVKSDLSLLQSSDLYRELVSDHYVKVMIFPKDLSNETMEVIANLTENYDGIDLASSQLTMYELNQSIIKGQGLSLAVAYGLVFISLLISLRHVRASLIAMIPIFITTVFLFAFLGMSGISLNLFTTTLFSITIGVGIDYAIHFTSIYKSYKDQGYSSEDAVDQAYGFSSRPIIANALGFSIGLSVLMISPLKVHFYVSSLMWVSMVLSSFLSLSLLPTLLKKLK